MRLATLALLGLALLAGCDSFTPSEALPALSNSATDPALLVQEPEWIAVSAVSDGKAYQFPTARYSASFSADGYVGGQTQINSFGGRYSATSEGDLDTRDLFSNLVGSSDRNVEKLEKIFSTELASATRFEIEGGVLQVRSANGDGIQFRLNLFNYDSASGR